MMAEVIATRSWNLGCTCNQQTVCFRKYNSEKRFCHCKYRGFKIGSKNSILCRQCEHYLGEHHHLLKQRTLTQKTLEKHLST